jgi:hypothetical protein
MSCFSEDEVDHFLGIKKIFQFRLKLSSDGTVPAARPMEIELLSGL